jgi:hypothetical protein
MSTRTYVGARDAKFEANAREQILPRINILAEAVNGALDRELNVVERLQFERGYN